MSASYLLVLLGVVMVSYSGPLVKGALIAGANPVTVAMLRMAFSAAMLLPILCIKRKGQAERPIRTAFYMTRKQWLWSLAASFFLAMHYLTWMTSLDATSTFASVALVCTQPLFVAAVSGVFLKEPMAKKARPGAVVALIGALLIGINSITGMSGDFAGDLLALLGAVMMAAHWLRWAFPLGSRLLPVPFTIPAATAQRKASLAYSDTCSESVYAERSVLQWVSQPSIAA